MESYFRIFADFQTCDDDGRVKLITNGTIADLKKYNIALKEGLEIYLDDNEGHCMKAVVEFSTEENIWVGMIDWNNSEMNYDPEA